MDVSNFTRQGSRVYLVPSERTYNTLLKAQCTYVLSSRSSAAGKVCFETNHLSHHIAMRTCTLENDAYILRVISAICHLCLLLASGRDA
jgi:hypothetical protein